ncbi:MAG: hypothetical protein GY909_01020 [Oligoflexia bacterium]|nr:hypothetical protein [Oligoflexia bacterium]
MSFNVTVKIGDYMEKFEFGTVEERHEFIEVTKEMNPKVQLITEEEELESHQKTYACL